MTSLASSAAGLVAGPTLRPVLRPDLRPDPGSAHDWLARELAKGEYQPTLFERLQRLLDDLLERIGNLSGGLDGLGWPFLVLIVLALAAVAVVVLARLRANPVGQRDGAVEVFGEQRRSAAAHRRLAEAAYADGAWDTAVLEAVRSLAADLAERGVTADDPGITTREVTTLATPRFPDLAPRLEPTVLRFEEVRYGGRHADRADADATLALARDVAAATPVAGATGPVVAVPR